jgi:hypothetical protein
LLFPAVKALLEAQATRSLHGYQQKEAIAVAFVAYRTAENCEPGRR